MTEPLSESQFLALYNEDQERAFKMIVDRPASAAVAWHAARYGMYIHKAQMQFHVIRLVMLVTVYAGLASLEHKIIHQGGSLTEEDIATLDLMANPNLENAATVTEPLIKMEKAKGNKMAKNVMKLNDMIT